MSIKNFYPNPHFFSFFRYYVNMHARTFWLVYYYVRMKRLTDITPKNCAILCKAHPFDDVRWWTSSAGSYIFLWFFCLFDCVRVCAPRRARIFCVNIIFFGARDLPATNIIFICNKVAYHRKLNKIQRSDSRGLEQTEGRRGVGKHKHKNGFGYHHRILKDIIHFASL